MFKQEDVIARSVKIEVVGEIERCHDAEDAKFYCLKVKIHFDNGEVKNYTLKSHGDPKSLENFLQNKKGLRDRMEKSFVLLKNGQVMYDYSAQQEKA